MIEIYKIVNQITPLIMNSLFAFRENVHNIRNYQIISNNIRKTVRYGLETVFHSVDHRSCEQIYYENTNRKSV